VAEDAGADEGGASGGERRFCEGEGRKKLLSGCVAPHLHRNLHVGAGGAWNNRSEFGGRPRGSYPATPEVVAVGEMRRFFGIRLLWKLMLWSSIFFVMFLSLELVRTIFRVCVLLFWCHGRQHTHS